MCDHVVVAQLLFVGLHFHIYTVCPKKNGDLEFLTLSNYLIKEGARSVVDKVLYELVKF